MSEPDSRRSIAATEAETLVIATMLCNLWRALEDAAILPKGSFAHAVERLDMLPPDTRADAARIVGLLDAAALMP